MLFILFLAAAVFSLSNGQPNAFCVSRRYPVYGVFSRNNDVYVFTRPDRKVWTLRLNAAGIWTTIRVQDINKLFGGYLQEFLSGFSTDELQCGIFDLLPSWSCTRKKSFSNVTVLFFGSQYKAFRYKQGRFELASSGSLPLNAGPEGLVSELDLKGIDKKEGFEFNNSVFDASRSQVVVSNRKSIWNTDLFKVSWQQAQDIGDRFDVGQGGFVVDGQLYFVIDDLIWKLNDKYGLDGAESDLWSFFNCYRYLSKNALEAKPFIDPDYKLPAPDKELEPDIIDQRDQLRQLQPAEPLYDSDELPDSDHRPPLMVTVEPQSQDPLTVIIYVAAGVIVLLFVVMPLLAWVLVSVKRRRKKNYRPSG